MRKVGMGIVALLLFGGSALARENESVQAKRLNRWAFSGAGPTEAQVVDRTCPHDRVVSVNTRRTAGDWTASVLSAFWYTPQHVTVQCLPR
jgi:hypothetical protein